MENIYMESCLDELNRKHKQLTLVKKKSVAILSPKLILLFLVAKSCAKAKYFSFAVRNSLCTAAPAGGETVLNIWIILQTFASSFKQLNTIY